MTAGIRKGTCASAAARRGKRRRRSDRPRVPGRREGHRSATVKRALAGAGALKSLSVPSSSPTNITRLTPLPDAHTTRASERRSFRCSTGSYIRNVHGSGQTVYSLSCGQKTAPRRGNDERRDPGQRDRGAQHCGRQRVRGHPPEPLRAPPPERVGGARTGSGRRMEPTDIDEVRRRAPALVRFAPGAPLAFPLSLIPRPRRPGGSLMLNSISTIQSRALPARPDASRGSSLSWTHPPPLWSGFVTHALSIQAL